MMKKNNEAHNHVHEPVFQVVKRDDMIWYKSWAVRLIAIAIALACTIAAIRLLPRELP